MSDILTADAATIARLTDEVTTLRAQLADQRMVQQGVVALRKTLMPLYMALQKIYEDSDGIAGDSTPATSDPVLGAPYWQTWKQRLNNNCARIIDVLIATPYLTNGQIGASAKMHYTTVSKTLTTMRKVGILATNGGKHSLQIPGGGQ